MRLFAGVRPGDEPLDREAGNSAEGEMRVSANTLVGSSSDSGSFEKNTLTVAGPVVEVGDGTAVGLEAGDAVLVGAGVAVEVPFGEIATGPRGDSFDRLRTSSHKDSGRRLIFYSQ